MKENKMLKVLIILMVGVILFAMTTKSFALDDSDSGLNFYEDQSDQLEKNTNTKTDTNTSTSTNTSTNTNTNTTTNTNTNTNSNTNTTDTSANNYNTSLPKAGAPENAMLGVAVVVLVIIAACAYKKINEYKNV